MPRGDYTEGAAAYRASRGGDGRADPARLGVGTTAGPVASDMTLRLVVLRA